MADSIRGAYRALQLVTGLLLSGAHCTSPAATVPLIRTTAELLDAVQRAGNTGASVSVMLAAGHFRLSNSVGVADGGCLGLPSILGKLTITGRGADKTFIESTGGVTNCPLGPNMRILHVANTGNLTLTGVTVQAGAVNGAGGGIYNRGVLALVRSMVNQNAAASAGGIFNAGTLTLTDSTVAQNTSTAVGGRGGGILNMGRLDARNSTIASNLASGTGSKCGGIDNAGVAALSSVTLAYNKAMVAGGGLCAQGVAGAAFTMRNTLVADNFVATSSPSNCDGQVISEGNNLDSVGHCFAAPPKTTDWAGTCGTVPTSGCAVLDAKLGEFGNNGGAVFTVALSMDFKTEPPFVNSPAVDQGDRSRCPPNDQRGVVRTSNCDIGAFQQTGVSVMPLGDSLTYGLPGKIGYREQLRNALSAKGLIIGYLGSSPNTAASLLQLGLFHEGHTGLTLKSIADLNLTQPPTVSPPWLAYSPNVVLMMGGTNDFRTYNSYRFCDPQYQTGTIAAALVKQGWEATGLLNRLSTETRPFDFSPKPYRKVFVASIPLIDVDKALNATNGLNGSIKFNCNLDNETLTSKLTKEISAFNALVAASIAGSGLTNVHFAEIGAILTKEMLWDGIHPTNPDGYDQLAYAWRDAVFPILMAEAVGDFDHNGVVDINDVNLMMKYLNKVAKERDPMDLDGDGWITILDVRRQVLRCTLPSCAVAN